MRGMRLMHDDDDVRRVRGKLAWLHKSAQCADLALALGNASGDSISD